MCREQVVEIGQIINSGYKCDYVREMREWDYGDESRSYFFNLKLYSEYILF